MAWEVRKRRASGAAGVRFAVAPVGEDEAGTWFLIEPKSPHLDDAGWVVALTPNPVLGLVPAHRRWVACTTRTGGKVDLCRSVAVRSDRIEFEDVELDVVWTWGQAARVEDIDEFEALSLGADEAAGLLAEAEAVRLDVDAGRPPFGPSFRQRLVDCTETPDPLLAGTWAGGVAHHAVAAVIGFLGDEVARQWLERQAAGEGWLIWGGGTVLTVVVWLDRRGVVEPVRCRPTPEAEALRAYLLGVAPGLAGHPPPPLTPA